VKWLRDLKRKRKLSEEFCQKKRQSKKRKIGSDKGMNLQTVG
jgi:hypothetical protein